MFLPIFFILIFLFSLYFRKLLGIVFANRCACNRIRDPVKALPEEESMKFEFLRNAKPPRGAISVSSLKVNAPTWHDSTITT